PLYQALGDLVGMGNVLSFQALSAQVSGDLEEATKLWQQTLAMYEQSGDEKEIALANSALAVHYVGQSSYEQARHHAQTALALARQQGAPHALSFSLRTLAAIELDMGFFERARLLFEEALELSRALNEKEHQVIDLDGLALCLAQGEDEAESQATFEEGLKIAREFEGQPYLSVLLLHMGSIVLSQGEGEQACTLLEEAVDLMASHKEKNDFMEGQLMLFHALLASQQRARCRALLDEARTRLLYKPYKRGMIFYLEALAHWLVEEDRPAEAVQCWSAASVLRKACTFPLAFYQRPLVSQLQEVARAKLGVQQYTYVWEKGEQLDPKDIVARELDALLPTSIPLRLPPRKASLPPEAVHLGLTRRELDVLQYLAEGLSNKEIAERLTLSVVTVNSYLRTIYSKLGVTSRTAAARYALDHGLLSS
ncbi:MAG TPA: LuxR C-terminal-related transcriptional regulator, partial [Ktedonosporobacter sp.]|nr:LuxR C-terminal-related transcriptional regulator [Ktedonosporobacter sp.]